MLLGRDSPRSALPTDFVRGIPLRSETWGFSAPARTPECAAIPWRSKRDCKGKRDVSILHISGTQLRGHNAYLSPLALLPAVTPGSAPHRSAARPCPCRWNCCGPGAVASLGTRTDPVLTSAFNSPPSTLPHPAWRQNLRHCRLKGEPSCPLLCHGPLPSPLSVPRVWWRRLRGGAGSHGGSSTPSSVGRLGSGRALLSLSHFPSCSRSCLPPPAALSQSRQPGAGSPTPTPSLVPSEMVFFSSLIPPNFQFHIQKTAARQSSPAQLSMLLQICSYILPMAIPSW